MKGRGITAILILLVGCSPYLLFGGSSQTFPLSIVSDPYQLSESEFNSSVDIQSDTDFVSQEWPGNGSEASPYMISNLKFDYDGTVPINIENTRAHFIVRNCIIGAPEIGPINQLGFGIRIINVTNAVVENCYFYSKSHAIAAGSVNNTLIRNNTLNNCEFGIEVGDLESIEVSNNSIFSGRYAMVVHHATNSSINGNLIVEAKYGILLEMNCTDNVITRNRIGWCADTSAFDGGSNNNWTGNSWSDWNEVGPYLIPGTAGSVDESPTLFDEDVLGPTFEYYRYNGVTADLVNPLTSFTFAVNVSDASAVSTVILYIRSIQWMNTSLTDSYGDPQQIRLVYWTPYIMEHQPIVGNPDRFTYTFETDRSFSATYIFWANDTLGYSRQSDIDSFSLGCCMGPPTLSNIILIFLTIGGFKHLPATIKYLRRSAFINSIITV